MKNLFLCLALTITTGFVYGQNTNVQSEVKTTVRTVKDSEGEKKTVKKEVVKEVQNIQLGEEKPDTKNIEMKDSPVQVVKSTEVTNPDGSTRTVDIDRSAIYEMNGNKYQVMLDAAGYKIVSSDNKTSLLRKTSTNSYIYITKEKTAVAYFNVDGNLVLESYDARNDSVKIETYTKL